MPSLSTVFRSIQVWKRPISGWVGFDFVAVRAVSISGSESSSGERGVFSICFSTFDGPSRANLRIEDSRESLDSRKSFQSSRIEPHFGESRYVGRKIANRRSEAIHLNCSQVMKRVFLCEPALAN